MKILKDSKKHKIKHLFEDSKYINTSFLKSYFEDKMGIAFVDSSLNPKSAQICVGDFSFFAGEPNLSLVKNIKATASKHRGLLVIDPDDDWRVMFEKHYGTNKMYPHYRQSFVRENIIFDITMLKYYAMNLPKEFIIRPIDEDMYRFTLLEKWSEDFCINFNSYQDFKKNGIGFVVLHKDMHNNQTIVAGASSYIYYEGGIEIQIATNKDFRNLGLATSVGATLILGCIENNINPSWDSANKISSKLAFKFGYKSASFYKAFTVKLK